MSFLGQKRWDIFLSHSHADAAQAKEIAAYLQERGLTVWFDQDKLRVGQLFDERIKQAIVDARALLVLVSQTATTSDYIKHEVSCALAHNIPVAPAFLELVPKEMLKAPLSFSEVRSHAVKLIGDDRPARLARLAEDLRELRAAAQRRWYTRIAGVAAAAVVMVGLITGLWIRGERPMTLAAIAAGDVTFTPPPGTSKQTFASATAALDFQVLGLPQGANAWKTLRNGDALASGDRYCLRAVPEADGYLYVFQQDSANKVEWVFPRNETSRHSYGKNPVKAGNEVFLPEAENSAYVLDDTVGTEVFYAYFSVGPLPELEEALADAARGVGVPTRPTRSDHEAPDGPFLATAKGMAGETTIGEVAREFTRTTDDRVTPFSVTPISFQSKGGFIGVQWSIRHVPAARK